MRKWMRERLKRRKQKAEVAAEVPPPLQPTFYDTKPEGEPPEPGEPAPEPAPLMEEKSTPTQPQRSGDARRRRRRRGGRGRGGRAVPGQSVATEGSSGVTPAGPDVTPSGISEEGGLPEPGVGVASGVGLAQVPASPLSRGTVVLAIGLPGSGKSSWFKRHSISPLSSDLLRALLFDDPNEQRFQDLIFSNLRSMLRARLIARRPMNYVDATNLTPHDRQGWIKLGKDYGYDVHAVFFDVPLEVCLERNRKRERVVAEDVMRRMAAKLKPPRFEEGFSKITVVRVKQKDG